MATVTANPLLNTLTIDGQVLQNVPAPKIPSWVKKYLTKLGGKTDSGEPYLKLAWGCEKSRIYDGERRLVYLQASAIVKAGTRVNIAKGGIIEELHKRIDIGKQRWYVEEWWPPEALGAWDEAEQGPFPSKGLWMEFICLETPEGHYREPDQQCMEWVKELWQARQQAKLTFNWREGTPKEVLQADIRAAYEWQAAKKAKRQERIKDRLKSSLAPHINRLRTAHPNEGKHGIYRRGNKPGESTNVKSDN